jgi:hypothetical protein
MALGVFSTLTRKTKEKDMSDNQGDRQTQHNHGKRNYITEDNYPSFKKQYQRAIQAGHVTFEHEGQLVLTDYARYVIEYVEGLVDTRTEQQKVKDSGRY